MLAFVHGSLLLLSRWYQLSSLQSEFFCKANPILALTSLEQ